MRNTIPGPSMFDDVVSLRDAVNSLFENSFLSPAVAAGTFGRTQIGAALNVYEDQTSYYVLGLFPGIDPGKIDLSVKENVLTIGGEYEYSGWPQVVTTHKGDGNGAKEKEQAQFRTLLAELPQGKFYRQVQLPTAFEFDKIEARYENGLLKLVLPKAERSQVKRISIQGTQAGQPQLTGGSTK